MVIFYKTTDDELLELAAKSGCKQLFIRLESISQSSLNSSNKAFNKVEEYYKIIKRIQSHGIAVQSGIVFGFDNNTKDIFNETIDFPNTSSIHNATFNILTPYPGTNLFKRLEKEDRILTYDWSKYNARNDVVFKPQNMTSDELLHIYNYVYNTFYSLKSITSRLSRSKTGLWWTLPLNLAYYFTKYLTIITILYSGFSEAKLLVKKFQILWLLKKMAPL